MTSIRTTARIMIAGGALFASITLSDVAHASTAAPVNCTHKVTTVHPAPNGRSGAPVFAQADIRSRIIKYKAAGSNVTSPARCGWWKRGPEGWRYVAVWLAEGGIAWMWWNDLDNNNLPLGA